MYSAFMPLFCLLLMTCFAPALNEHVDNPGSIETQEKPSLAVELVKVIREQGLEAATQRAAQLRAQRDTWKIDEREINSAAYGLLRERRAHEAELLFRLNIEFFPESWNVWDSFGQLLMVTDRTDEAKAAYRKSLELNPGNTNAQRMLAFAGFNEIDREGETKVGKSQTSGIIPGSNGPWLGQQPPGEKGVIFAPGIVSVASQFDFSCTFTPDGDELYFTTRADAGGTNTIMVSRRTDMGWTTPAVAPFSGSYFDFEPHISPDGSFILFGSRRPSPGSETPRAEAPIWKMARQGDGWGEPEMVGPGMFATTSKYGRIYMTDVEGTAHGIVSWLLLQPRPDTFIKEGGGVNDPAPGVHPCIAPDESFIIFDSIRADGVGGPGASDLYVCFKQADGTWGPAINLGPDINTPGENICASLSPDGRYLFYTAHRDIWWVDMAAVLKLRK